MSKAWAAGILGGILCLGAVAQTAAPADVAQDVQNLLKLYPELKFANPDAATAAQEQAAQLRNALQQRYQQQEADCFPQFFAASCVESAKEELRRQQALLHKLDIAAACYKREQSLQQREKDLSERQREHEEAGPRILLEHQKREQERAEREQKWAQEDSEERARAAAKRAQESQQKRDQAAARQRRHAAELAEAAKKRADNEAEYAKKQQDSDQRQLDLAKRKQERLEKQVEDKRKQVQELEKQQERAKAAVSAQGK